MPEIVELWSAIENSDAVAVREVLANRPDLVEAADEHGLTPLMRAVSHAERKVELIEAILEAGADVNRQTFEGYTALHCAIDVNGEANLNAEQVIDTLIKAGANLELRQHYGWTPLLRAVVEGTAIEVKSLLAAGADPNKTMPLNTLPTFNAGRTTLMGALTNPQAEEIVELLLHAGADPSNVDENGITFLEYAERLQRESGPGEFSLKVKRCADIVRRWLGGGA